MMEKSSFEQRQAHQLQAKQPVTQSDLSKKYTFYLLLLEHTLIRLKTEKL